MKHKHIYIYNLTGESIRRWLLYTMLILCCSLAAQSIAPCPPNNITTNPAEPLNPGNPNYINPFDWTSPLYFVRFDGALDSIANPNSSGWPGVSHLRSAQDFNSVDGWELLRYDTGLKPDGTVDLGRSGHLFLIMYNKYRSIIRVFVLLDSRFDNRFLEISLGFSTSIKQTALFSALSPVQAPLRYFNDIPKATNLQTFSKGWRYADFPVSYDPCTCKDPSNISDYSKTLTFEVNLYNEGAIILANEEGENLEILSLPYYLAGLAGSREYLAASKSFHSIPEFKSYSKKLAKADWNSPVDKGLDELFTSKNTDLTLLEISEHISSALALLHSFTNGQKGSVGDTKYGTPMASHRNTNHYGKMGNAYYYISTGLFIPGSNFEPAPSSSPVFPDSRYPLYNEILGIYNLLDKPSVDVHMGFTKIRGNSGQAVTRRLITVNKESIKLVINPAAKLELVEAYVQLTLEGSTTLDVASSSGGNLIDARTWVSDLLPLNCIDEYAVVLDINEANVTDVQNVLFGLVLRFKTPNGDYMLHKSTYEASWKHIGYTYPADFSKISNDKLHEKTERYHWFTKPEFSSLDSGNLNVPKTLVFENETILKNYRVRDTIILKNCIVGTPDKPVVLTAGKAILQEGEVSINSGSSLNIFTFGTNCDRPIQLANPLEITGACNSVSYLQRAEGLSNKPDDNLVEPESIGNFEVTVYPNPTAAFTRVFIENLPSNIEELSFTLFTATGEVVLQQSVPCNEIGVYLLNMTKFPQGYYTLRVSSVVGIKTTKIILL